ncbi:MAG TPA: glycosyltransferase [Longimicrobiales bacterium]|nr:glycosyltransferase [Longimicrobiales bacterium]
MRVAIVHDWLTGMRGGERVLEAMLDLFPDAEIFALLHVPGSVSPRIEARPIHTSPLQRATFVRRRYRRWLPLFPLAVEALDPRGFDLVLSSSHCVAKAVRPRGAPHLCYCHTPMRYAWDQLDAYLPPGAAGRLARTLAVPAAAALRRWDAATVGRVDAFVANSAHVRGRIRRCWGRDAAVVHPPVAVERFRRPRAPEDFYLVLGALVPYKRVELAIRAAALAGRRLVVAGDGPELPRLRALAGPGVTFLGRVSDDDVADLYARCRAFLFPGVEDFGIAAVEAQAAGAPVVARAAGGALETVAAAPEPTGVFFAEPSPEARAAAMRRLEAAPPREAACRASAERFATPRFHEGLSREIERLLGTTAARPALAASPPVPVEARPAAAETRPGPSGTHARSA